METLASPKLIEDACKIMYFHRVDQKRDVASKSLLARLVRFTSEPVGSPSGARRLQ